MARLDDYLSRLVSQGSSDLHLSSNHQPFWRLHGRIGIMEPDHPVLTSDMVVELVKEVIPPDNFTQWQETGDTDCAYELHGTGRFRINGFRDRHGFGAVFRHIPETIPTFDELHLPESVREMCFLSKGLIVVTGPTGSGKSTTLAAMVDFINKNREEHVITIEDPIEFVHSSNKCLVNQREVHRDTKNFPGALRAALREDPDIVLIGEIRDLETMETAIETAETGHLVFATLHTNTAITTIDRIIDRFPGDRQNQIRSMLADTLKGVVAQVLCPRIGGGRVAAFEVLIVNTPVAALIREAKTHMLLSTMENSRNIGMQTFTDALCQLVAQGLVTPADAYIKAVDKPSIETKFRGMGIELDFRDEAAEAARQIRQARIQEEIEELREKHQANPDDLESVINLAWILATSPHDDLRDGKKALRLAEAANGRMRGKNPDVLTVLAAALAEHGSYRKAVSTARSALKLYEKAGDEARRVALAMYLRSFENERPHREL